MEQRGRDFFSSFRASTLIGLFVRFALIKKLWCIFRCVDLRTGAFDVPPQEILTRDSVTVTVDAVVYYQVERILLQCFERFLFRLKIHWLLYVTTTTSTDPQDYWLPQRSGT